MSVPANDERSSDSRSPRDSGIGPTDRSESDAETLTGNDASKVNEASEDNLKKHESSSSDESGIAPDEPIPPRHSDGSRQKFRLEKIKATGPGRGFNPTNARFHIRWDDEVEDGPGTGAASDPSTPRRRDTGSQVDLRWSSRYNRKGRNSFVVTRSNSGEPEPVSLRAKRRLARFAKVLRNILRMFTTFPYWDMAFWSGWAYSIGSVLFIFDGAFSWVPTAFPYTEFSGEDYSVGYLFFVGALFYEVGASVAYLEAINDGSFHGSAMKRLLEGHESDEKKLLDEKLGAFFGHLVPHTSHDNKKSKKTNSSKRRRMTRSANTVGVDSGWFSGGNPDMSQSSLHHFQSERRGGVDYGAAEEPQEGHILEHLTWRWWPTWQNLKNHHIKELGYWACAIQLFGATIYGMCGIVAIPGILNHLQQWQENAAYWIPQIVASACFVTASLLFTLETQEKWWKPEPTVLGWWIGAWATVGSFGFLLSGSLGPAYGDSGAQYQSDLSAFWGSTAFLFSGLLQWYEAVNKHPIEELFTEPGELKSFQVHPA